MKRWALFCSLLFVSHCGVTVGNSGPPSVTDESNLASLVSMQLDEDMGSSSDSNTSDAAALVDPVVSESCVTDSETGVATVSRKEDADTELEFGRLTKRKVLADSKTVEQEIKFVPALGVDAILCNDKGRPILSWAQLIQLQTEETLSKTRQRTVTLKSDASVLTKTNLTASTKRKHDFSKESLSLGTLVLNKTSSFESSVRVENLLDGTALERQVKTLSGEPMVLQRTFTRGSGVTAAKIVSGATESSFASKDRIVLRYQNLTLRVGENCVPTTGSIAGSYYANDTDTEAATTFTIQFSTEGAVLVHADGSEDDLDLEICKI